MAVGSIEPRQRSVFYQDIGIPRKMIDKQKCQGESRTEQAAGLPFCNHGG
jgi:hypothetical protein